MWKRALVVSGLVTIGSCCHGKPPAKPTIAHAAETDAVVNLSIAELGDALAAGKLTSVQLVDAYAARIGALDHEGPALHAILALAPDVRAQAKQLDDERKAGKVRGPLHGIPILVKDNIETRELPTTAGALALANNRTERDAPIVARLRAAGALVLGKANMAEWANIRSRFSTNGWSALGGLTRNPYALDRSACGSSAGSGAAVAAGFAAGALGSETDGSITCPAAMTGLVGLKPTVGLMSRTGMVPIAITQDTAGPMTRTVRDAALLLSAMAGTDPADAATAEADAHRVDYTVALDANALRGKRLGVARFLAGNNPGLDAEFDRTLGELRAAGAELVEIKELDTSVIDKGELTVLLTEFKAQLNAYLAKAPAAVPVRSLADVIAFQKQHGDVELRLFGQELLEKAQGTKGVDDPEFTTTLAAIRRAAGPEGIDRLLRDNGVVALVAPSFSPAYLFDLVSGDPGGGGGASQLPAVAGYPHLTVPMGQVHGLPVGLSFIGPAWSEASLLALGYAFEQRTHARKLPTFAPTVPTVAP